MEQLNGERKETLKYFANGHFYHKMKNKEMSEDNESEEIVYRCATRSTTNCPAIARENESTKKLQFCGVHVDSPSLHGATICRLKEKMLKMSAETDEPFREIFDSVLKGQDEEVQKLITFDSVKTMMRRKRNSKSGKIPETMEEFVEYLENNKPFKDYFQEYITVNESSALLFLSNPMLKFLRKNHFSNGYIEDSIHLLSTQPEFPHLYTVSVKESESKTESVFTPIWVLMANRSFELYDAVWYKVLELVPELKIDKIKCGFKANAVNALYQNLGESILHGTWHHYILELLAEWKSLKVPDNCKNVLWMALGLPLAPLTQFQDGINIIQTEADKTAIEVPQVNCFMTYLRTKWIPLSESINSFHCNERMDPFEPTFFTYLLSSVSQVSSPDTLKYLKVIGKLMKREDEKLQKSKEGIKIKQSKMLKWTLDKHINATQEKLLVKGLPLKDFLLTVINCNRRMAYGDLLFQMTVDHERTELLSDSSLLRRNENTPETFSDNLRAPLADQIAGNSNLRSEHSDENSNYPPLDFDELLSLSYDEILSNNVSSNFEEEKVLSDQEEEHANATVETTEKNLDNVDKNDSTGKNNDSTSKDDLTISNDDSVSNNNNKQQQVTTKSNKKQQQSTTKRVIKTRNQRRTPLKPANEIQNKQSQTANSKAKRGRQNQKKEEEKENYLPPRKRGRKTIRKL